MSDARTRAERFVLPNLGAEEGSDWAAYPNSPHARVAGRLFGLLFSADVRLASRDASGRWSSEPVARHWPAALGPPAVHAVADWLDADATAYAWLNSLALRDAVAGGALGRADLALAGPTPDCVAALHDKAFALEISRATGLHSPALDPLLLALSPEELADADAVVARLSRALDGWPAWTGRRFTLKPRHGTSGRGRVGGTDRVDTPAVRGALPRLARAGGAIFEPWLERTLDLSACFRVAAPQQPPQLLARFELITNASGVYRGHCGVVDGRGAGRGEIRSGERDDEAMRDAALAVAARAAARGFVGPGGLDAFRYREGDPPREKLRGAVELNARPTMGLVVWGLLQRIGDGIARRAITELPPSPPFAFLFTVVDAPRPANVPAESAREALLAAAGDEALVFDLSSPAAAQDDPRPLLLLGPDRARLRSAHRAVLGC